MGSSEEGPNNHNISTFLEQLSQIQFGEYNILVYEDVESFRQIYSNYAKNRLEENEIVLLLPYFESVDSVLPAGGMDRRGAAQQGRLDCHS